MRMKKTISMLEGMYRLTEEHILRVQPRNKTKLAQWYWKVQNVNLPLLKTHKVNILGTNAIEYHYYMYYCSVTSVTTVCVHIILIRDGLISLQVINTITQM